MSQQRYQAAKAIFIAALEREGAARIEFVARETSTDPELRALVDSLLASDDTPHAALGDGSSAWVGNLVAGDLAAADAAVVGADALHAGDAFGPYRVLGELGVGGMGMVYAAEQQDPRRQVALKVMGGGRANPQLERRFEFESEALARLQHPGIATIFDAGTAEIRGAERRYFAMELVAGASLTGYATQERLGERERIELLIRVCEAVQHAHQNGLLHRDLKPSNILVGTDGQPKVLDFGIARALDGVVEGETLTIDSGQVIGTLGYMSPEQARGERDCVDTRSDVYALGVLGFELLCGALPIETHGRGLGAALEAIMNEAPRRLRTLRPGISRELERVFDVALRKDPNARYQSAAALGEDLRRYLRREPLAAYSPSTGYQFRKLIARHPATTALAGLLVLSVLTLGSVAAGYAWQASAERDRVIEQRDRAIQAETRAAERFDQVRALVDRFVFDVEAEIQSMPAALPARKLIVEAATEYLESVADDVADDPELAVDLARTYIRLGDLLGGFRASASLGDYDGAQAAYARARELLDGLNSDLAFDPTSEMYRRAQLESQQRTAQAAYQSGRVDEAIAITEQVADGWAALAAEGPDDLSVQREVVLATGWLGIFRWERRDLEGAVEAHERQLALTEALVARDPQDIDVQADLAYACQRLGLVREDMSEFGVAEALYRRGIAVVEAALVDEPEHLPLRRRKGSCLIDLGDVLELQGRTAEALDAYRRASDVYEAAIERDPSNLRDFSALGTALERLSGAHERMDQFDDAVDWLGQAADVYGALVERQPSEPNFRRNHRVIQTRQAVLLVRGQQFDAALALLEVTLAGVRERATAESENPEALFDLVYVLRKRGEAYEARATARESDAAQVEADLRAALACWVEARALLARLDMLGMLTPARQPIVDQVESRVVELTARLGEASVDAAG